MADEKLKQVRDQVARLALKTQAEAAQHIYTCPRCERLFLIAYDAHADQFGETHGTPYPIVDMHPADVWRLTRELLPEFRPCTNWPKGF